MGRGKKILAVAVFSLATVLILSIAAWHLFEYFSSGESPVAISPSATTERSPAANDVPLVDLGPSHRKPVDVPTISLDPAPVSHLDIPLIVLPGLKPPDNLNPVALTPAAGSADAAQNAPTPQVKTIDLGSAHSGDLAKIDSLSSSLQQQMSEMADDPDLLDPAQKNRRFVMSMCRDLQGRIWLGCEPDTEDIHDGGVWCFDPSLPKDKQWKQFTTADGLGDNSVYAIACDRKGRIWAGHLNHGISVFNGNKWQNYEVVAGLSKPDSLAGPLGERVFHITVNPRDGDVWMATSAGLSRYSESKGTWRYYTRAGLGEQGRTDGLPSNQASSIAFDADGNIYVATQCDGIAMADAKDDYKTWRQVKGPDEEPTTSTGDGIPSNLTNDVWVARDGTVYLATDAGLAWSKDKGQTWQFVRGLDWADKVRGLYGGPPKGWTETPGAILAEDYCTCLAEDKDGKLYVGHRQRGVESVDVQKDKANTVETADYAQTILADDGLQVGTYGKGPTLGDLHGRAHTQSIALEFPTGAAPPTLADLNALLKTVAATPPDADPSGPAVLGLNDDWRTEGDWLGRYGRYWACCCAMCSPNNYLWGSGPEPVKYFAMIGPNHDPDDGLRYWVHWLYTKNPKSLEIPPVYMDSRVVKHLTTWDMDRRQAEWDDHGEAYPKYHEGPDIYCTLTVPTGLFYLSLFDMDKDGHVGDNRYRDYKISIRSSAGSDPYDTNGFAQQPELVHQRINCFWGGMYKRFLVRGPVGLTIKTSKNNSLNTILAGVFLDSVDERPTPYFKTPSEWHESQQQDARRMQSGLTDWKDDPSRQAKEFVACDSEKEAATALQAKLLEMQEWNPQWWATNHQRIAMLLSRWCQTNLPAKSSPESIALKASFFYQSALYQQWENCQTEMGERTARQIEKSLRWDGITNHDSGDGLNTVTAFLSLKDAGAASQPAPLHP